VIFRKFKHLLFIYACINLVLIGQSCRSKKVEAITTPATPVAVQAPMPDSADSLITVVKSSDMVSKWFAARVNVESTVDKETRAFNANLRICKDSAIWMSISPGLGIEVARVLIDKDSVRFINRLNSTYFKGGFDYLNKMLQVDVNFKMIQAVLLGNVYLHYGVDKYIQDRENTELVLSTLKFRKIKRENELEIPQILTQEIWYSPAQQKITKMEMQDYRPIRKFNVRYNAFETVEGISLPVKINIEASANKELKIVLDYSKIGLNKELNLPFNIPDGYESIR
jgi:hypothetical protein